MTSPHGPQCWRMRADIRAHFAANHWWLFDLDWFRNELEKVADDGFDNAVAAKLLLRK